MLKRHLDHMKNYKVTRQEWEGRSKVMVMWFGMLFGEEKRGV